jgi:hypothetical protein
MPPDSGAEATHLGGESDGATCRRRYRWHHSAPQPETELQPGIFRLTAKPHDRSSWPSLSSSPWTCRSGPSIITTKATIRTPHRHHGPEWVGGPGAKF